ncbi:unnamed protein product [Prunus armeniaca]|uniref:Uncharacterized protein n=1 Tax=Prunus armeniaca TaxID=36596 RepID=A0A6J5UK80_PRUAR|nr:unnamed protein product [Prunus armeniaca]
MQASVTSLIRWGTTNIVAISNEGCCDAIYVAVDTSATSLEDEGFIMKEDATKFFYMGSCNVLATMAGNSADCENMLSSLNGVMERACETVVNNGIHCAPQIARTYIRSWETCSTPHDGVHYKTKSEVCNGFANGSGSDKSSGYLRVFKVNKTDTIDVYRRSVLEALSNHNDALASYLHKSLFFLFPTKHYKYTHEHNVNVDKVFREIFPEDYVQNVVVKKGEEYTVRLVHFNKPVDELYEQLRIENLERDVSPQLEAQMEQVGLEQFQKGAILFGMPTQMLVAGLIDVLRV